MIVVRLVRALIASIVILLAVVGFPILFYKTAGPPIPYDLLSFDAVAEMLASPDDGTLFLTGLGLLAWGAWAAFSFSLAVEVVTRVRGVRLAPRLPGLGGMQRVSAYLVASITFAMSSPLTAAADTPAPPVVAMAPFHQLGAEPQEEPAAPTYRVKSGDTLWKIADDKLGSARRWPKLWKLNARSPQPGGRLFTSPELIRPGWQLRMPSRKPAPEPAARPMHQQQTPIVAVTPASTTTPTATARPGEVVELSSGSLVALSYAAGISTAFAVQRFYRRRRHVPPPASQGVSITPEPEAEPAVREMRRAHRRSFIDRDEKIPTDTELMRAAYSIEVPYGTALGCRVGGTPVILELAGASLGLTGPTAANAARYLIVDLLRQASNFRAEVVLCKVLAKALLSQEMPTIPGLVITDSTDSAIEHFEQTHFGRSRMLMEREATDIETLRTRDPGEPLPNLLLVTGLADDVYERVGAALTSGKSTGVGAVILGDWPGGTTCQLDDDHQVIQAKGPLDEELFATELFHLTAEEAAAHLRTLLPPSDPPPTAEAPTTLPESQALEDQPEDADDVRQELIRLNLIGPPTALVRDREEPLQLSWMQLSTFAYLALHPKGVTRDQLTAALWPDETGKDVHNTLRHLRTALVTATGYTSPDARKAPFINASTTKNSAVYRIDANLVGVDLWDYQAALNEAKTTQDAHTRITALSRAAALCNGELAPGLDAEWLEDRRYPLIRSQADVLSQLAEHLTDTDPEQALDALERARVLDPDADDVYFRIMRLQVRLDRPGDARRTAELLRQHQCSLGIPTSPKTEKHIADLLK
jgi:DNA-binding SARP family transcriptional activator